MAGAKIRARKRVTTREPPTHGGRTKIGAAAHGTIAVRCDETVAQRLVAHTGGGIAPLEAYEVPIMRHLGNQQS